MREQSVKFGLLLFCYVSCCSQSNRRAPPPQLTVENIKNKAT